MVFKCYKTNTEEQIKSNLKWEREYRLKELKIGQLVYYVPILLKISYQNYLTQEELMRDG